MLAYAFDLKNYARTVLTYYDVADVTIRQAQPSDFQRITEIQVSALYAACGKKLGPEHIRLYVERHLFQIRMLCTTPTFYVAVHQGGVVASGGWTWVQIAEQKDMPCVVSFFVHPSRARLGIGRSLLAITEASAKSDGVSTLTAFTPLHGTDLFRHAGYTAGDVIPFDLGEGLDIDLLLMRKRLSL